MCRPENIFKNVGIWGKNCRYAGIEDPPFLEPRPSPLLTPRHKKAAAFGANPKSPNLARYMKWSVDGAFYHINFINKYGGTQRSDNVRSEKCDQFLLGIFCHVGSGLGLTSGKVITFIKKWLLQTANCLSGIILFSFLWKLFLAMPMCVVQYLHQSRRINRVPCSVSDRDPFIQISPHMVDFPKNPFIPCIYTNFEIFSMFVLILLAVMFSNKQSAKRAVLVPSFPRTF